MEEETGVEASMTEEDIKEHIEMVRKEIYIITTLKRSKQYIKTIQKT